MMYGDSLFKQVFLGMLLIIYFCHFQIFKNFQKCLTRKKCQRRRNPTQVKMKKIRWVKVTGDISYSFLIKWFILIPKVIDKLLNITFVHDIGIMKEYEHQGSFLLQSILCSLKISTMACHCYWVRLTAHD